MRQGPSWSAVPRPFAASVAHDGRTLRLRGDIDHSEVGRLAGLLEQHVGRGGAEVEVSEVTFLPAAAAGLLVTRVELAARRDVDLRLVARPSSFASRVLVVMGVAHHPRCLRASGPAGSGP